MKHLKVKMVDLEQSMQLPSFHVDNNYKQLETIGDCILKFVVSASLYQEFPNMTQRELNEKRSRLVNNEYLHELSYQNSLSFFVLPHQLRLNQAIPNLIINRDKKLGHNDLSFYNYNEQIAELTKADLLEALIYCLFFYEFSLENVYWQLILLGMKLTPLIHNKLLANLDGDAYIYFVSPIKVESESEARQLLCSLNPGKFME